MAKQTKNQTHNPDLLRQAAALLGRLGGLAGKGKTKRRTTSGAPAANARWAKYRARKAAQG